MTGMDDLVTWLRVQLDEDERVARDAGDRDWTIQPPHPEDPSWSSSYLLGKQLIESCDPASLTPAEGEHIARWDPARVLAEVDAKRQMLDWCDRMQAVDGFGGLMARDARKFRRLLALPYADRPGYREEWRPTGP